MHQAMDTVPLKAEDEEKHVVNHYYEHVFRITLSHGVCCDKNGPASLIFLKEINIDQTELDQDCLDRAVFERLLLKDPAQHIVRRKESEEDCNLAVQKNVVFYLYQCYYRLRTCTDFKNGAYKMAKTVIMNKIADILYHAKILAVSNVSKDLMRLILHYHGQTGHCEILSKFLVDVTTEIVEFKSGNLIEILKPSFGFLHEKLATISLLDKHLLKYIQSLNHFTGSDHLIKALLKYSMPKDIKNCKSYQSSLLGLPLAVSCLPKSEFDRYEFFQDPSRSSNRDHALAEERLQVPLITVAKEMHRLFEKILRKSADSRELLLQWIGNCLDANSGHAKIWNSQLPKVYASLHASDGFFINLTTVLLLLCRPFIEPCSPKLLKINPLYCSSPLTTESNKNGVHLRSLVSETCLLPRDDPMKTEDSTYNFITECFFATHYAFRIGFHVVNEKMMKQNQDLICTQRLYEEARSQGGETSDIGLQLKEKMEEGMTKFLSYRTALLVPETLHLLLNFHIATSTWLSYISTKEELNIFRTLKFPPLTETSCALSYVPEFILKNIIDCTIFLKRFNAKTFELAGSNLEHFMTLILMLMGSPERVKNPHLRAHLAEMLELLMPEEDSSTLLSGVYREKLFTSHLFVNEMIPTLLNVFVSIEMTGQSMQFEQKFQYRRPMYIALDYLWNFDIHKIRMKEMAEHAERKMESPHKPIFLHFINHLISDAIFLLDEALTYMSKLEEIQQARNSGAWDSMSSEQQHQKEGKFHHIGLLAKFHNVMSNETINTLQWLTTEIKSIFCHTTIVDRITAMLNFFLLNLVGPMKKNFKVKDLKEYEFKPQELVQDICKIYQNLGALEDAHAELFCSAISRDGRSYNGDLFPQAQMVLKNIGQGILASQLEFIASKVHQLAKQQLDDELTGAPGEFLDSITNTLVKDPVKLPSSEVTKKDDELLTVAPAEFLDPTSNTLMNDPVTLPASGLTVGWTDGINEEISTLECRTAHILEPIPGLSHIDEYKSSSEVPRRYFCRLCQSENSHATILEHLAGYKHQRNCLKLLNPELFKGTSERPKKHFSDIAKTFFELHEAVNGRERVNIIQEKKESKSETKEPLNKKRRLNEVPSKKKVSVVVQEKKDSVGNKTMKSALPKKRKLCTEPSIPEVKTKTLHSTQTSSLNHSLSTKINKNSLTRGRRFTLIDVSVPKQMSLKRRPILIDGSNLARGYSEPDPIFHSRGIFICVQQFIKMGHHDVTAYIPKWRRTNLKGEVPTVEAHLLDYLFECKNLKYTCSKEIATKRISCYDDIFLIKQAVYKQGVVVSNDQYRDLLNKYDKECPGFDEVIKKRVLMFLFDGENLLLPNDPQGRFGLSLEKFLSL